MLFYILNIIKYYFWCFNILKIFLTIFPLLSQLDGKWRSQNTDWNPYRMLAVAGGGFANWATMPGHYILSPLTFFQKLFILLFFVTFPINQEAFECHFIIFYWKYPAFSNGIFQVKHKIEQNLRTIL